MKIVIDGLIGAGKSTQAELLSEVCNFPVVKEPIDEWPLDKFYEDPSRWGLMMQAAVLTSFVRFRDTQGIFERSPESSGAVFWRNLVESGVVTTEEDQVFRKLANELSWEPDVMIYIDKSPEKCHEHIQKRNQVGDEKVSLEYLKTLEKYYKDFCEKNKTSTHIVDGNQSIDKVHQDIVKIINVYIKKICPHANM